MSGRQSGSYGQDPYKRGYWLFPASFLRDAGDRVNPVDLPGGATVGGESLFRADFVGGDRPDGEADEDVAAAIELGVIKFASAIAESADSRDAEDTAIAGGEADVPLMRLRIVEAKGEKLKVARGAVGFDGREVGAAVPDFVRHSGAVHLGPLFGTGERMDETADVHLPGAEVKVKVVLAVADAMGRSGGGAGKRRAGAAGLGLSPRSIASAGLVGDPVDLPGAAAVGGERLLKVWRSGGHAGPVVADKGGFAVDVVGGVEVAAALLERADLRRVEAARAVVGPVEAPLAGGGIVEAESEAFDVARAAIDLDGVELSAAVPDFVTGAGTGEFGPVRRVGEGMEHAAEVIGEVAEERIEVVRTVVERREQGWRRVLW